MLRGIENENKFRRCTLSHWNFVQGRNVLDHQTGRPDLVEHACGCVRRRMWINPRHRRTVQVSGQFRNLPFSTSASYNGNTGNVNASGNDESPPTVTIANNFEEYKVTYTEYDSEGNKLGNAETTWKVEKGEK